MNNHPHSNFTYWSTKSYRYVNSRDLLFPDWEKGVPDGFTLTWIKIIVCPLAKRLSTAHFRATWLPLSLSMATAINLFNGGPPWFIAVGGAHILYYFSNNFTHLFLNQQHIPNSVILEKFNHEKLLLFTHLLLPFFQIQENCEQKKV